MVTVMPKAGVLDPQGQAVAGALAQLGFDGVGEVRELVQSFVDLARADRGEDATLIPPGDKLLRAAMGVQRG